MYQKVNTLMFLEDLLAEPDPTIASGEMMAKRRHLESDSFGARLRRAREAKGFTQRELAEAASTSQRMIAYYETRSGTPAAPVLLRLAHALKVDPGALMGLAHEPLRSETSSPQNLRLWRKLRRVEKLPRSQRKTVIQLIDALVEGEARKKQRG